jgi:hypothetical protein
MQGTGYLRISEWLFLLSAGGLLASLPWLDAGGFPVWVAAQALYFVALAALLFKH